MERYIKDNMTAVLYSPGFGAGWAHDSWNDCGGELAMRKEIIEWLYKHDCIKEEIRPHTYHVDISLCGAYFEDFITNELEYEDVYFGGAYDNLILEYVPCGVELLINEYDGSESIEIISHASRNVYYI